MARDPMTKEEDGKEKIVVAIRRADGTMEFNPSPDATIQAGDEMVVLGQPQSVKALGERVAA